MRYRRAAIPAATAALFLALPVQALPVRMQVVSLCTRDGIRDMAVPDEDAPPVRNGDCALACHMAAERRKTQREDMR